MFYYRDKNTWNPINKLNQSSVFKPSSPRLKYRHVDCSRCWSSHTRTHTLHPHSKVYETFARADTSSISPYHGNHSMWGSVWLAGSVAWEPDTATMVLVKDTHTYIHTHWQPHTTSQTFGALRASHTHCVLHKKNLSIQNKTTKINSYHLRSRSALASWDNAWKKQKKTPHVALAAFINSWQIFVWHSDSQRSLWRALC